MVIQAVNRAPGVEDGLALDKDHPSNRVQQATSQNQSLKSIEKGTERSAEDLKLSARILNTQKQDVVHSQSNLTQKELFNPNIKHD